MSKPQKVFFTILFLTIGIVSCMQPNTLMPPFVKTETLTVSMGSPEVRSTTSVSHINTETPMPPSPSQTVKPSLTNTLTLIPSQTSTPETGTKRQCLELIQTLPFNIEGWVVMGDEEAYLLNVVTGDKDALLNHGDQIGDIHISPDRQRIAYRGKDAATNSEYIEIISSNGESLQRIPWEDAWRLTAGWYDNERVWISKRRSDSHYEVNDALLLLNPSTGQQQELMADFPRLANYPPGQGWSWFWGSVTIYDPTLSRVVYPGGFSQLILWDVLANQERRVLTGTLSLNVTPKWSPDGQHFLITGASTLITSPQPTDVATNQQELFSVSRDGEVTRLTFLTKHYSEVQFGNYSWSPDSRYVAFSLEVTPSNYPDLYPLAKTPILARFAVLDTLTQELTDYCVPNSSRHAPVWSPDGGQVVIENNSRVIDENEVYLIDLRQEFVIRIAEDTSPVGWIVESP